MFCKPDTEADNIISSAYKKQPKNGQQYNSQLALKALSLKINKAIKILKLTEIRSSPA